MVDVGFGFWSSVVMGCLFILQCVSEAILVTSSFYIPLQLVEQVVSVVK